MQYLFMALLALGIVALDQLSKAWVVNHISSSMCRDVEACAGHIATLAKHYSITEQEMAALPHSVEAVPGVFKLSFIHNTGAAWSSFEGMIWLFVLIFVVLTASIIWEFSKKRWGFTMSERWMIAAIYGGGLGNMIDRIRLGFVVDMIELDFMNFPVFNVADCFITCGCILLMIHLVFFNKKFWKDEKKK